MGQSMLIIILDAIVFFALIVIKTIYFFQATRRRTIKRWVYFNHFHIMDAPTPRVKQLRQWQNALTLILFALLLLSAPLVYFINRGII